MPTREEQKKEAIKRLELLNVIPGVIAEFEEKDILNKSETYGALYWLDDEEKEFVREFEKERNAVVYHVIRNNTEIGVLYSLMYVSQHKDKWERDREDIKNRLSFVFVYNKDTPHFSEFGTIGIQPCIGGVVRIA